MNPSAKRLCRYLLLSVALFTRIHSAPARAQWVAESSGTTNDLRSVLVFDSLDAAAAGLNSTLLFTSDEGKSWAADVTSIPGNFYCLNGAGNYLYLVGDKILYASSDSLVWYSASMPASPLLSSVDFCDDAIGIAVGKSGTVLRSSNQGFTWSAVSSGTTNDLNFVLGYPSGEFDAMGSNGTWIESLDSGKTWSKLAIPTTQTIESFDFDDVSLTGWVVGSNLILKTTDYGVNWIQQSYVGPPTLYSLQLIDSTHAFACGDDGRIIATTDGSNWPNQSTGTQQALYSLGMFSQDIGWSVGAGGTVIGSKGTLAVAASGSGNPVQSRADYPNPFVTKTSIQFFLAEPCHVSIAIYDLLGRRVELLQDGILPSGRQSVTWDASNAPSGVYLCRVSASQFTTTSVLVHSR